MFGNKYRMEFEDTIKSRIFDLSVQTKGDKATEGIRAPSQYYN